jgi:hypothetical protein
MDILPVVVPQDSVCLFCYWQDGLQKGMRYQDELYTLVGHYAADDRLAVYDKSLELASQGKALCITTVSGREYSLWQALRTVAHAASTSCEESPPP